MPPLLGWKSGCNSRDYASDGSLASVQKTSLRATALRGRVDKAIRIWGVGTARDIVLLKVLREQSGAP